MVVFKMWLDNGGVPCGRRKRVIERGDVLKAFYTALGVKCKNNNPLGFMPKALSRTDNFVTSHFNSDNLHTMMEAAECLRKYFHSANQMGKDNTPEKLHEKMKGDKNLACFGEFAVQCLMPIGVLVGAVNDVGFAAYAVICNKSKSVRVGDDQKAMKKFKPHYTALRDQYSITTDRQRDKLLEDVASIVETTVLVVENTLCEMYRTKKRAGPYDFFVVGQSVYRIVRSVEGYTVMEKKWKKGSVWEEQTYMSGGSGATPL